jgi:uncharacterized protein YehS (DUF1456 family)
MNNGDILRRIRYTFSFSDDQMMKIFKIGGKPATRAEISDWLKKEDHEDYKGIYDKDLAVFLNGFITVRRGKKDGPMPAPEKTLNNNLIFRKLKIALALKDTDIIDILELADFDVSKHEITALFRKPGQSQYRACKDQFLRNFLHGMQLKYRKDTPA